MNVNNDVHDETHVELSRDPAFDLPLIERSGYQVFAGTWGKRFEINQNITRSLLEVMRKERVGEVVLLGFWVKKNINLSFLQEFPELRAVAISSYEAIDWRPLQHLPDLQQLWLVTHGITPQPIDFTAFPNLFECGITWHSEWASILESQTLQHLSIRDGRPITSLDLRKLPSLKECFVVRCNRLQELVLSPAQRLQSLKVARCRSFRGARLSRFLAHLEFLYLEGKSRFNLANIGKMNRLRRLWLNTQGKIPTVRFLKNCKNLETLMIHFGTNVVDGDLGVLQKLKRLRKATYDRTKRHYHPKYADEWFAMIAKRCRT